MQRAREISKNKKKLCLAFWEIQVTKFCKQLFFPSLISRKNTFSILYSKNYTHKSQKYFGIWKSWLLPVKPGSHRWNKCFFWNKCPWSAQHFILSPSTNLNKFFQKFKILLKKSHVNCDWTYACKEGDATPRLQTPPHPQKISNGATLPCPPPKKNSQWRRAPLPGPKPLLVRGAAKKIFF